MTLNADEVVALVDLGARGQNFSIHRKTSKGPLKGPRSIWCNRRPITSLFPLPVPLPKPEEGLRIHLCFNVHAQQMLEPITPMGLDYWRGLMAEGALRKKVGAWLGDEGLFNPVQRVLPHNITTEMGLTLWRLARQLKAEGKEPTPDHPGVAGIGLRLLNVLLTLPFVYLRYRQPSRLLTRWRCIDFKCWTDQGE